MFRTMGSFGNKKEELASSALAAKTYHAEQIGRDAFHM